jgi:hypothetical protein
LLRFASCAWSELFSRAFFYGIPELPCTKNLNASVGLVRSSLNCGFRLCEMSFGFFFFQKETVFVWPVQTSFRSNASIRIVCVKRWNHFVGSCKTSFSCCSGPRILTRGEVHENRWKRGWMCSGIFCLSVSNVFFSERESSTVGWVVDGRSEFQNELVRRRR